MGLSWKRIIYYLILIIGVSIVAYYSTQKKSSHNPVSSGIPSVHKESGTAQPPSVAQSQPTIKNKDIPDYVLNVLNHVLANQKGLPNYVGGRIFENREQKLNTYDLKGGLIEYKEWDVHPKVKGENRGAERLITGSDHSAYYTADHYQTFIKIKL